MLLLPLGVTEQRRRGDNSVKCPVCVTSWDHMTSRPSSIICYHGNPPAAPVFPPTPIINQLVIVIVLYL